MDFLIAAADSSGWFDTDVCGPGPAIRLDVFAMVFLLILVATDGFGGVYTTLVLSPAPRVRRFILYVERAFAAVANLFLSVKFN